MQSIWSERAENRVEREWQKNDGAGAEREVTEWERIGERAESAAHSLLTVGGEIDDLFCWRLL